MTASITIGAVLAQLEGDFPDISISKIRFLESKGLITPERKPSGYRVYTPADVDRLRYILRAQRDWFWPLKVIREALDAMDRGLQPAGPDGARPSAPAPSIDPAAPTAETFAAPLDPSLRLTPSEVAASAGVEPAVIDGLITYGLLRPDASGHLDGDALAVAHAAAGLARYGVEPRHLRPFRTAADRELGLVEQVVATARRSGEEDVAATVLAACVALHTALVRQGLHSS